MRGSFLEPKVTLLNPLELENAGTSALSERTGLKDWPFDLFIIEFGMALFLGLLNHAGLSFSSPETVEGRPSKTRE